MKTIVTGFLIFMMIANIISLVLVSIEWYKWHRIRKRINQYAEWSKVK